MIDFTGVQAITIPEGNVTKITNASGTVLWEKAVEDNVNYVNYLEAKGTGTTYIDTGFKPNQDTRIVMELHILSWINNTTAILGARSSASKLGRVFWFMKANSIRVDYNAQQKTFTCPNHSIKFVIDSNKNVTTVNGTAQTFTAETFQSPSNLYLFDVNQEALASRGAKIAFYNAQIYDNDVLIRDYHACLDPDGVPCVYDKVNKEYVYNSGTGTFGYA